MVSEILLHLLQHPLPDGSLATIDALLESMKRDFSNNPKLVELFSVLAVRTDAASTEAVGRWIGSLPELIFGGKGGSVHRQVVKQLLKQRNEILMKSLPQNFDYFALGDSAH